MAISPDLAAEGQRLAPAAIAGQPSLLRQLTRDRTALIGLIIVCVVLLCAIAAPLLAPYDPTAQDVVERLEGPSSAHLLGTDHLGRDELSRILYGARASVFVALAVGIAVLFIGVTVGLIAGLVGGFVDALAMRTVDVLLAIPELLIGLAIVGALGPGLSNLAVALVAVWWVSYARLVRGLVLGVRAMPFVEAARAQGAGPLRVALRHILPNVASPVVVLATLNTARLMLGIAALSFLGLGVQPPTAEWGAMLSEGREYLASAPQLMLWPGLAITITALGLNLLGDGLRDVLDPNLR